MPPQANPTAAFIALGSNVGSPARQILDAMERLAEISVAPLVKSSLWESDPVDCPAGSPSFMNAVVSLVAPDSLDSEALLDRLQSIEREAGRKPKLVINEPRPLDLDLIGFGQLQISTSRLVLPHPRAHLRRFVLAPLCEIAPELQLPGWTAPAAELLRHLPGDGSLHVIRA